MAHLTSPHRAKPQDLSALTCALSKWVDVSPGGCRVLQVVPIAATTSAQFWPDPLKAGCQLRVSAIRGVQVADALMIWITRKHNAADVLPVTVSSDRAWSSGATASSDGCRRCGTGSSALGSFPG